MPNPGQVPGGDAVPTDGGAAGEHHFSSTGPSRADVWAPASAGGDQPHSLHFSAIDGQGEWIAAACELEAAGCSIFTTTAPGGGSVVTTRARTAFPLRRADRGSLSVCSWAARWAGEGFSTSSPWRGPHRPPCSSVPGPTPRSSGPGANATSRAGRLTSGASAGSEASPSAATGRESSQVKSSLYSPIFKKHEAKIKMRARCWRR
jgi:hypothetical protein